MLSRKSVVALSANELAEDSRVKILHSRKEEGDAAASPFLFLGFDWLQLAKLFD